jgi:hypothetical protein
MRETRLLDLARRGEGELLGLAPNQASQFTNTGHGLISPGGAGGYGVEGGGVNMGYGVMPQQGQGQMPAYVPVNKVLERAMNAGAGYG